MQYFSLEYTHKLKLTNFEDIITPCLANYGHNAPMFWCVWDIILIYIWYKFELIPYNTFPLNVPAS